MDRSTDYFYRSDHARQDTCLKQHSSKLTTTNSSRPKLKSQPALDRSDNHEHLSPKLKSLNDTAQQPRATCIYDVFPKTARDRKLVEAQLSNSAQNCPTQISSRLVLSMLNPIRNYQQFKPELFFAISLHPRWFNQQHSTTSLISLLSSKCSVTSNAESRLRPTTQTGISSALNIQIRLRALTSIEHSGQLTVSRTACATMAQLTPFSSAHADQLRSLSPPHQSHYSDRKNRLSQIVYTLLSKQYVNQLRVLYSVRITHVSLRCSIQLSMSQTVATRLDHLTHPGLKALTRTSSRLSIQLSRVNSASDGAQLSNFKLSLYTSSALRMHIFGLTHRTMVKRLATSPHDSLVITDSAYKNQSVTNCGAKSSLKLESN
ncbi:putative protein S-acyltransferase 19-like [Dorcoceras hygrometricum]|uniref:Uncharacterized protein n=1 Tax=Dorcoceras hygrometricum TaxID=472368 RepID=A0A2Z7DAN0_9LAMI|nr:putative protein S-acyltransferase 19-like [Dorcoceras hygrometricum]